MERISLLLIKGLRRQAKIIHPLTDNINKSLADRMHSVNQSGGSVSWHVIERRRLSGGEIVVHAASAGIVPERLRSNLQSSHRFFC
jgi:hypothetical protein